jgi:hypothetical protein
MFFIPESERHAWRTAQYGGEIRAPQEGAVRPALFLLMILILLMIFREALGNPERS